MTDEKIIVQDASEIDSSLLYMLDRGFDDIEAERTLSYGEAMKEIQKLRKTHRLARESAGIVVNA